MSGSTVSPLFRPEALLAPERFYGELLLIRPFSLASLGWLAAGLAAAIVSFLFFGEYRETVRASAIVTGPALQTSASDGLQLKIHLKSSGKWVHELAPGRRVAIRCLSCVDQSARIAATILQVAPSTVMPENPITNAAVNETVQIALAVPSRVATSPDAKIMQPGAILELTVPIGRRSLAHWLLERLSRFALFCNPESPAFFAGVRDLYLLLNCFPSASRSNRDPSPDLTPGFGISEKGKRW